MLVPLTILFQESAQNKHKSSYFIFSFYLIKSVIFLCIFWPIISLVSSEIPLKKSVFSCFKRCKSSQYWNTLNKPNPQIQTSHTFNLKRIYGRVLIKVWHNDGVITFIRWNHSYCGHKQPYYLSCASATHKLL